jgi:hypothetical protein
VTPEVSPAINQVLANLAAILENTPPRLLSVTEGEAAHKPGPDRWSKKEILGHLIDSAANNHQRFVRAQLVRHLDFPEYDQDLWVATQSYATESWTGLVNLWVALNRHILHMLSAAPESALVHEVSIGGKPPIALGAVVEGYVRHVNHHLGQILS